jgi:hypothetical protein
MCLNTHVNAERHFARWQLDIGHGKFTDETGSIRLPDHFKCAQNTMKSLIETIYPGINQLPLPSDQYFAEQIILTRRNNDVDDINEEMLRQFPKEEKVFVSADSVKNNGENGNDDLLYPVEYLI